MKEINYIKQPTDYLYGQACMAMLAGVTVKEVVSVMQNDKGIGKKDIEKELNYYGNRQAKAMKKADNSSVFLKYAFLKCSCRNTVIGFYITMESIMTRNLD